MCNGLDAISSGGVSTGTGFRTGIDLVGAVSWFGVEKLVTRRRSLLSCKTISMHYIDDGLCPHAIPFLHYFYT